MAKTAKKKAAKKFVAKKNGKAKSDGPTHKAVQMMLRKTGATLQDFKEAGFNQAAMSAIKAAERRHLKTKVEKKERPFRYFAFPTKTSEKAAAA